YLFNFNLLLETAKNPTTYILRLDSNRLVNGHSQRV
ncbi:hypothetical protein GWI33_012593, partial [Rhynchophorus ferrugineus]